MQTAQLVTDVLTGKRALGSVANNDRIVAVIRQEIPAINSGSQGSIVDALVHSTLAGSNTEARRLLQGNAVVINGQKITRDNFEASDFIEGQVLMRKGKNFKDSALIELI